MKYIYLNSLVFSISIALTGCANLQSLNLETSIPPQTNTPSNATKGKVVHLDAQQRLLVVSSLGKYCAEPSPDALVAFASSLGFGISKPAVAAASLSQAMQSSAGSIGLRTQSITLMRDWLYRTCEASSNGEITKTQTAMIMNRTQDLMTVILAIEQLTGAVSANQLKLESGSGSNSSASIISNQKELENLRQEISTLKTDTSKLKADKTSLEKQIADARSQLNGADNTTTQALNKQIADYEIDKQSIADSISNNEDSIKEKEKLLATLSAAFDSALTTASTRNTTTGGFANNVTTRTMSDAAAEHVAKAVENMVTKVLEKPYTMEMCLAILTSIFDRNPVAEPAINQYLKDGCFDYMKNYSFTVKTSPTPTSTDNTSQKIKAAIASKKGLDVQISGWLSNTQPNMDLNTVLADNSQLALRQKIIAQFDIK